eukprot:TRINITY_DN580_c1_g1_i2.p1 TRINITY_DN580_c1_g1~~TRINITY_DN580_c1_g1_i2.p1  ORF type:complete len:773 (-),score=49.23 TRINITY_DN580_c1_g1_i2:287-2605(-)
MNRFTHISLTLNHLKQQLILLELKQNLIFWCVPVMVIIKYFRACGCYPPTNLESNNKSPDQQNALESQMRTSLAETAQPVETSPSIVQSTRHPSEDEPQQPHHLHSTGSSLKSLEKRQQVIQGIQDRSYSPQLTQQPKESHGSKIKKSGIGQVGHHYKVSNLEEVPQPESGDEGFEYLRSSLIGKGKSRMQIRWRKEKKLGCGAFSTVYLVWSETHQQNIAVKEIPYRGGYNMQLQQSVEHRLLIQQSENEVNALRSLNHSNIIKYLGCERDVKDLVVRVFMEYIGNYTLLDLVRKQGCLDEDKVRRYTKQILQGLSYLHQRFIIHRDIKGSNIIWSEKDDTVKLADFGAAKQLAQYLSYESSLGNLHGTPQYMSPEALRGEKVSYAADIWGVGCVIIEMFTGKSPWNRTFTNKFIAVNVLAQKQCGPPIPEECSQDAKNFLGQCFRINPRERPTAEQLLLHPFMSENEQNRSQQFLREVNEDTVTIKERSLSAPITLRIQTDTETMCRTTCSSIVINSIVQDIQHRRISTKLSVAKAISNSNAFEPGSSLFKQINKDMERMQLSIGDWNPMRSYYSEDMQQLAYGSELKEENENSVLSNKDSQLVESTRYQTEDSSGSLPSMTPYHNEGELPTTLPHVSSLDFACDVSVVNFGSVRLSPKVGESIPNSPQVPSHRSSNFSTESHVDENMPQGLKLTQNIVKQLDSNRRPLHDSPHLLNQMFVKAPGNQLSSNVTEETADARERLQKGKSSKKSVAQMARKYEEIFSDPTRQ